MDRFRLSLAALPTLAGCVAPGADVHLAPFYSRTSTADGRIETELLGGLWQQRDHAADGSLDELTVGPFYSLTPHEEGYRSYFLVPLGFSGRRGPSSTTILYPLFVSTYAPEKDGSMTWSLAALPGVLAKSNELEGFQMGLFPLWGKLEDFLTFDQIVFIAFPLFAYGERAERVTYSVLWPLVSRTYGGGESSFRVLPFYSRARSEGRYDRLSVMWPFFIWQQNHLGGGNEEPETVLWFWPFYGLTRRGTYRAHTTLWPFFGYAHDPRSGFWALDLPWPFVRLQRGPADVHRTRFWPFYSFVRADHMETLSFLWPIIQFREERYPSVERDSSYVVPFWQAWDRRDLESGETAAWRKLFPVFQYERFGERERGSFPTLDPFWRNELIDRHFGWIWKLWEWRREGPVKRDRSWLGLYKRERSRSEERRSLAGIWSERRYHAGSPSEDVCVRETSLLFGLIRWRVTEGEGFDMLPPALPGPGWPAHPVADPGGGPGEAPHP